MLLSTGGLKELTAPEGRGARGGAGHTGSDSKRGPLTRRAVFLISMVNQA